MKYFDKENKSWLSANTQSSSQLKTFGEKKIQLTSFFWLNLKGEKKTAQRVVVENRPPLTSVHLDLVLYEFSISVFIFS